MNRILLTLAAASILVTGCGQAALAPAASTTPAEARTLAPPVPVGPPAAELTLTDVAAAAAPGARVPGDFVVYRFTGSFRKATLTLTERVIDRKGALLTVDLTAVEGDKKQELRVKIDESSPSRSEVVSVARLEGGVEKPATIEAYEALMARTTLAADQNEAFLGTEDVTLEVGGASLPCRQTSYRVRVGKKVGTLKTCESKSFAWGDVGGEITTTGGKVLYRAEVVETGHEEPTAPTMATSDGSP